MWTTPWISIWYHPRETIRKIIQVDPNRSLWFLAWIYGFSSLLNLFQSTSLGFSFGIFWILLLALIFAPFWGYLVFSFWAWVIVFTGRWFKGRGNFLSVRSAYAWSCVPLLFNAFFWILLASFFGQMLFLPMPQEALSEGAVIFLFIILVLKVVLAVWSFVIYLNTLAEVQEFSILRAIGNIIVATIFIAVVLAVIWSLGFMVLGMTLPSETSKAALQIFQYMGSGG